MYIRKAAEGDLPRIMEIYAVARRFMAAHGNPNQWGPTNWPPEETHPRRHCRGQQLCLCPAKPRGGGVYFRQGKRSNPPIRGIENGAWKEAGP